MQQSSGHGRGLTVTGVLFILAGLIFGGVAGFLTVDAVQTESFGRIGLLYLVGGLGSLLFIVGILATLLGVAVSGVHASLLEQTKALARIRG